MTQQGAPDNHLIYGRHGVMRGIQWPEYVISPDYPRVNHRVFGNNGLTVGQCWARQVAAVRDGAHGHRVHGVSGSMSAGAYSVIVGRGDNEDHGHYILYLPAGSSKSSDQKASKTSPAVKALTKSIETGNPVRVIRASSGRGQCKPREGLRYDGLYRVWTLHEIDTPQGGSYLQFKLVRFAGQGDLNQISQNAPTAQEVNLFGQVGAGY